MLGQRVPDKRLVNVNDPVTDLIEDIFDVMDIEADVIDFECYLNKFGFMIVPIEDPTNLRYGADE